MRPGALIAELDDQIIYTRVVALILACGLLLRLVWLFDADHLQPLIAEAWQIAQGFARTGVISDAYHFGSGPTAHAAPLWPAVAGTVYRLFGLHSGLAEYALSLLSHTLIGISIVFFARAMALLGMAPRWRILAIGFAALVPLNFHLETQALRTWEQGIAAALIAVYLWLCLRLDTRAAPVGWRSLAGLALLAAPFQMISPSLALGAYGCLGLLTVRRKGIAALPLVVVLSAVLVAACAYPWALRNETQFGEKIWTRTNFGIVFAEGFHADAVAPADARQVFVDRMAAIDPYERDKGYRAMLAAGGEQGYNRALTAQTMAWVRAHPADSLRIAGRHVAEFFFPPQWQWSVYASQSQAIAGKQALVWLIAACGLAGVGWGLWRRQWRNLYLLAMLALPALPYILAQPIIRYRYLITTLMVFAAVDFVGRMVALAAASRWWRRATAGAAMALRAQPPLSARR